MSIRQPLRPACLALAAAAGAALTRYLIVVRPWPLRWGATAAEATRPMPGGDLFRAAATIATRAITIAAPPGEVWPWLVQMGYRRAGWYSYDQIDQVGSPLLSAQRTFDSLEETLSRAPSASAA